MVLVELFFFQQRSAYEVRISDWRSDVCSSDLSPAIPPHSVRRHGDALARPADRRQLAADIPAVPEVLTHHAGAPEHAGHLGAQHAHGAPRGPRCLDVVSPAVRLRQGRGLDRLRSEEHTSELQSLMRNSYAVFCLK